VSENEKDEVENQVGNEQLVNMEDGMEKEGNLDDPNDVDE
jgi:hypothetical protein